MIERTINTYLVTPIGDTLEVELTEESLLTLMKRMEERRKQGNRILEVILEITDLQNPQKITPIRATDITVLQKDYDYLNARVRES